MDISEKFNLNLEYILIGVSNPDNQDDALYKTSFTKLIDILWSNNFETTESGDKLWSLVLRESASSWWRIRSDTSLRLCLNEQRDLVDIGLFQFIVNNGQNPSDIIRRCLKIALITSTRYLTGPIQKSIYND